MAIPPPPPPGPPPPPVPKLGGGGGGLGALGGGSNSGDSRNALLLSIQKGAKLKKTVTNDKSGPAIAGKVTGSSSSSNNGERRAAGPGGGSGGNLGGGGGGGSSGGGQKLGGIFGGMSEMPKLKPVNRGANQSTLNRSPPRSNNSAESSLSTSNSSSSNIHSSSSSNSIGNGGALDLAAELTQHLTLKKKKQQQSTPSAGNVTEANLRTNRGPPPQPPPPPKNPPALPSINGVQANASSLFGTSNGTTSSGQEKSQTSVPRSPPVAPPGPGGPVFPSQNHFGTMRAPPSKFQSQETISSTATQPVNGRPIGRPTVAPPPRPPPNKPPPPPLRSVSNQNLPQMPLSTPTTNTLNSAASANNVSALKEQLKHHIGNGSAVTGGSTPNVDKVANTNGNGAAPPLPPHRTCPAPPPPSNTSRQANNVSSSAGSGPPVPPTRHSSIRSVSQTDSAPLVVKNVSMNYNGANGGNDAGGGRLSTINRIIVDLESKFADRFHNPTEFPKPAPFFKSEKHYPSLSRAKNGISHRK